LVLRLRGVWRWDGPPSWVYRVEGAEVDWQWDPCCSHPNPVLHLKWSVDGSRTLHFTLISGPPDRALAFTVPADRRREEAVAPSLVTRCFTADLIRSGGWR
jgi:hypothetical protein